MKTLFCRNCAKTYEVDIMLEDLTGHNLKSDTKLCPECLQKANDGKIKMFTDKSTVKSRILTALESRDMESDNLEKIITLAYYMGREHVAKEVCDSARKIFSEQKKRALELRYHKLGLTVQGNIDIIYHPDYAGDIISLFGNDKTKL